MSVIIYLLYTHAHTHAASMLSPEPPSQSEILNSFSSPIPSLLSPLQTDTTGHTHVPHSVQLPNQTSIVPLSTYHEPEISSEQNEMTSETLASVEVTQKFSHSMQPIDHTPTVSVPKAKEPTYPEVKILGLQNEMTTESVRSNKVEEKFSSSEQKSDSAVTSDWKSFDTLPLASENPNDIDEAEGIQQHIQPRSTTVPETHEHPTHFNSVLSETNQFPTQQSVSHQPTFEVECSTSELQTASNHVQVTEPTFDEFAEQKEETSVTPSPERHFTSIHPPIPSFKPKAESRQSPRYKVESSDTETDEESRMPLTSYLTKSNQRRSDSGSNGSSERNEVEISPMSGEGKGKVKYLGHAYVHVCCN